MTKNDNIFYYFIFLLMNMFRFFRKKSKLVSNETWISVYIMNISNPWGDPGAKCGQVHLILVKGITLFGE
mgnify:CR=1 FL=1